MTQIGDKIPNTRYVLDDRAGHDIITIKGTGYSEERMLWRPVETRVIVVDGVVYRAVRRLT